MTTRIATQLAGWVAAAFAERFESDPSLTHLKLQKLCFFAAGAAWAHDAGACLNDIRFEAWKHGPVLRDVYSQLGKHTGPIAAGTFPSDVRFDSDTEDALTAAVDVYGALQPWALREQSHLEAPWHQAKLEEGAAGPPVVIENAAIEAHFRAKFRSIVGVTYPEYLVDAGVFRLDGLRFAPRFKDFFALAQHVRESRAQLPPHS